MKNINNLLLATFLRKKVPYDSYIKQVRCKNSKEYPIPVFSLRIIFFVFFFNYRLLLFEL